MMDMKQYYPDWHKWFTIHPEDIGNYFRPPAPPSTDPVSAPESEITRRALNTAFMGMVKKVDETAKTIEVARNKRTVTFAFDDEMKITQAGIEITLNQVEKGKNVLIEYKMEGKKRIATAIRVLSSEDARRKKPFRPPMQ